MQINKFGVVSKDLGYFSSHVDVDGLLAFCVLKFGKYPTLIIKEDVCYRYIYIGLLERKKWNRCRGIMNKRYGLTKWSIHMESLNEYKHAMEEISLQRNKERVIKSL